MKILKFLFAIVKTIICIGLSPLIIPLFFYWNKAFLFIMTHFWPNLSIQDENGKLYLRRFFFTPKMRFYRPRFLHYIAQSDRGRDPHDHPGAFYTHILKGGYVESIYYPKNTNFRKTTGLCIVKSQIPGTKIFNPEGHTHMVELLAPTWSWVKGWNRGKPWGFWKLDPIDATKDVWTESNEYGMKGVEISSWHKWF